MNYTFRLSTNSQTMKTQKLLFTLLSVFILNFNARPALPALATFSSTKTEALTNSSQSKEEQLRVAQMKRFAGMSLKDYEQLKGKKLNFIERISFRLSQRRMKKMLMYYDYGEAPTTLQKISWLLKGLLFGPLALLFGYIFMKDDERELIKWIWFGFIGFAAIVALALLL